MPRQRKPQSGVARAAGRVANTTTSWRDIATTNAKVYRIPAGGNRLECPAPLSEVGWVYPISVRREGNVFYVSLPEENLKSVIEGMDSLDLSNVTVSMNTVDGPLTINGSITSDWTITGQSVEATTITATTWNITNIVSNSITADAISTDDLNTDWLTVTNNATIGGTLWVVGATTLGSTLAVTWNITVSSDLSVTWDIASASITATTWDITTLASTDITASNSLTSQWTLTVEGNSSLQDVSATTVTTSWDVTVGWNETIAGTLDVTWASNFTGDVSVNNFYANWTSSLNDVAVAWNETITWTLTANGATTLNSSLTVAGASTLGWNTSVAWNLSVAWNETVTWNSTVTWDGIFSNDVTVGRNLNVSGDATITDDLTVNGASHFKNLETTGSSTIGWTLRVDGAITAWNGIDVTGQVESDTMVTGSIVAENATINGNLVLGPNAQANQFVLQSEKDQPNGIPTLNSEWKIDNQYLPEVFTTAKVKIVQWVFNNSNTATVVDEDITVDSAVIVTNYQDIVGDTTETISVWQITVVSNATETGSFKVVIFKPVS